MEMVNCIAEKFEKYCRDENYDKIKEYLYYFKFLANYDDGFFFEIVADAGNVELVKLFVENGADITIDDNYILYTCAYHNYVDCVKYLLSKGAEIENIKLTCGYENALNIVKEKLGQ